MPIPALSVVEQISTALSVASLRNEVIASNIANRDTQGYQRLKLRFEQAFDQPAVASVSADVSAPPVSLEQDLVALSTNSARYEALARALSRYFSIVSSITGSSRG